MQKVFPSGWVRERIPVTWYKTFFSKDSTLAEYYGDVGKNFVKMYENAYQKAGEEVRQFVAGMVDNGLVAPPLIAKRAFKGVKFLAGDKILMGTYDDVLRGIGKYSDPVVQRAAIDADPALKYIDYMRQYYAGQIQSGIDGVGTDLLNIRTYLPKHTPVVTLKSKTVVALAKAKTAFDREAIYALNDPMVNDMVEKSIKTGAFKNAEEAFKTYYDYTELVVGGRRIDLNDNAFLQHMVKTGQAQTIDEARGKIIRDLQYRESSLTPRAASLDFKREVSLPWYDPNPARVMSAYALDASSRLALAKTFGKNDEVIREMIGKISTDPTRSLGKGIEDAKIFDAVVREIMGQAPTNRSAEEWSAWFRTLQVPKLAFAQVLNIGQVMNYLLPTSFQSVTYGIGQLFRDEGIRNAIKRGVVMNSMMNDMLKYTGGGTQFANKVLQYSGFAASETINRAAGSGVAEHWSKWLFRDLLKIKGLSVSEKQQQTVARMLTDKREMDKLVTARMAQIQSTVAEVGKKIEFKADLREIAIEQIAKEFPQGLEYDKFLAANRKTVAELPNIGTTKGRIVPRGESVGQTWEELNLRELGIDVDEAVSRGYLDESDLAIAAQNLVKETQFLNRSIDLSTFMTSPLGKVMVQFKNFAYLQVRFLTRQFKRDLSTGNYKHAMRNLLILGTVFPMTGEVLADVRSLITQEKRPTPGFDRYMSNLANTGVYGLFFDFVNSSIQGKAVEAVAGITVVDASRYLQALLSLPINPETNGTRLLKYGLRQTGVGRPFVNLMFPPQTEGKTFFQELQDWSGDQ